MKNIKNIILVIIFSLLIPYIYAAPKKPDWVSSYGTETKYKDEKHLTGFGVAHRQGKTQTNYETAKASALNSVSSMIRTRVISSLEMMTEETNEDVNSYAKSNIQTSVFIELSGIKEYLEYYDKKDDMYYALCVLDKNAMQKDLEIQNKKAVAEYKSKINYINTLIGKKQIDLAAKEYKDSNQLLEKINKNYLIINYLSRGKVDLNELYALFELKSKIFSQLKSKEILNIEDAVKALLEPFYSTDFKGKTFDFIPAYYKSTSISSDFYYYLAKYCIADLEKKGAVHKAYTGETESPDYIFKGAFFETKEGYRTLYSLTDTREKRKIETNEIELKKKFVESTGLKILPDNAAVAIKDSKNFTEANLTESKAEIKIWTNKGSENLVFKRGEELEFYVKTNRSGYITILYHLAGDKRIRTPLIENYYIPPEKVYKAVKITDTFEVYPPFGSETAQVFFSPEPNEKLKTVTTKVDGEEYDVLAEDFEEFLMKKRGLKKKIKKETAETFITITTVK